MAKSTKKGAATAEAEFAAKFDASVKAIGDGIDRLRASNAELADVLQQFVNGIETGMIDSPADETLENITRRAKAAIAKARA